MNNVILQPTASTNWLERALEQGTETAYDLPVRLSEIKDPEKCPIAFLPFLAWEESISDEEGWAFAEGEAARRNLIARSADIHKKKGTIWAIREVFRMLGLGEIELLENVGRLFYDGTYTHNEEMIYGGDFSSTWATYIVRLRVPITNDQAEIVKKILAGIAPARSELRRLDYSAVAIRYNAVATHDGTYNYGSA
ncbi:phage tail protein I [Pelistega sp. MC2]|uniref:phage tail protein I n=1 Tax=Pelistega sp. MC2 TaxID=1720297 RepID=UPI0008DAE0B3|nr:phage tail protein I [Pelistega sp. MC2]